ncbi:hypothetical protein ABT174_08800 [Streptomyces sparsogenes]|uniref:hypothetical protein n=1 Tax=Streptomyces sparsogenes TaxID=67365 RepID=UPI0033234215
MSTYEFLNEAAAHWESVGGCLTGDQARELRELADRLAEARPSGAEPPSDSGRDLAERIARVVAQAWGTDAPRSGGSRFTAGTADWSALGLRLRGLLDGRTATDEVSPRIRRRLFAATSLIDRDGLLARGGDPDADGLLRLQDEDGRVLFPDFQFRADGNPDPTVIGINRELRADDDPWGAADWWLGRNAWIGMAPVDLLASGDDTGRLWSAALALAGEE